MNLACLLLIGSTLGVGQRPLLAEWELHDSLGHQWNNELLTYRLDLKTPVDFEQPFTVVDQDGQPVTVQILERLTNDQKKVVAVRLALITGLQPFGQYRFRLLAASPKEMPTDLTVKKDANRWLLQTSKIGVAIPAGESRADTVQPLSAAPAPILSLQGTNTGWVGKGWWTGARKVRSWKTELLASGPVLAWARIRYEFDDGRHYTVDIRVPAGQQVVLVREERHLPEVTAYETDPAKGDVFHLALGAGLKPTHVYSKRVLGSRGHFVEPGPEFKGTYLTPAQMHYISSACNIVGTWREGAEQAPFVGLFPRFLSKWDRPHHTFVPLAWDKDAGLVARFFLAHGSREWGLFAGGKKDMIVPRGQGGEGRLEGYFDALLLNNQWGETPLDKVKNWVLDWGAVRYEAGKKYAVASRGRGTMPYFAEQCLRGGHRWEDTYIHVHQTWTGEGDGWNRYREFVKKLPPDQVLSARAAAAFEMYKQTDPDYWPAGNWIGPANPNMIYMGNASILMGSVELVDHPMAKQWAAVGFKAVRENLVNSTSPDGAWIECPGYDGGGINPILRAALELRRTGLGDLLSDGRLLRLAMAHAHMVTPPDPRVGNVRHLPEFGDCFDLRTDKFAERARPTYWKTLVPVFKDKHPKEMGQILWSLGEKDGPVPVVPIDGNSRHLRGFGVIFRHAFNTPGESYLAIHQDSFGFGHYNFDLGSLYFFAKGAPLVVDWPSMYTPQITEAWMHNCVSVARMKRFAYKGRVMNVALSPRVDYARSRVYHDKDFPPKDGDGEVPQNSWQRQVLFVKRPAPSDGVYLIVRDAVKDPRATDWNLWTLSNKLRLQKQQAEVTGQYGVDMTVRFFVGPDATPTTEMFGFGDPSTPGKNGTAKQTEPAPGITEVEVPRRHLMQQNVIRLASASGGQYGAILYPRRPTEPAPRITLEKGESVIIHHDGVNEWLFVYPDERSINLDGDITFVGRAGMRSRYDNKLELHLLEGKLLQHRSGLGVRGTGPVSLSWTGGMGSLEVRTDGEARELEISLPNRFQGQFVESDGVQLIRSDKTTLRVRIDSGPRRFVVK